MDLLGVVRTEVSLPGNISLCIINFAAWSKKKNRRWPGIDDSVGENIDGERLLRELIF